MIRETINIGQHSFICDYYDKSELSDNYKTKFVMLRPIVLNNDAISIPEVFILEKSIITDEVNMNTVYPVISEIERYTSNIDNFIDINKQFYSFYNKDNSEKIFDCNILKIYHPNTKTKNNKTIIHVYTIINNVKFHFFCKPYLDNETHSNNEFIINNSIYSEYIEIPVPNIRDLISKETYYNEDIIPLYDNKVFIPTYTWILDYVNITENSNTYRQYLYNDANDLTYNFPLNITIFPYSKLDFDTYLPDTDLDPNSDSFVYYNDITITSKLGFNNKGKLVVQTEFDYKDKDKFSSVKEAYQYYKGVSFADYLNIEYEADDEHYDYDTHGELLTKQYQCAYLLELASDTNFKNIIYRSQLIEGLTLFNDVDNRNFEIPIFTRWEQLPELLIARIIFIDRYLGIITESNFTVITKEYYKYLVRYTDTEIYRIDLQSMQDKFVENVKCIIKKNTTEQSLGLQNNMPKIIYKPVFYKVQDLQNIQIRQNVTQNIGVNLINYLSKVESFNINIDGLKIIESARNDSYVIFKIQANKLKSTSGTYHICNQDDEYISSGQWSIY